ncbi:hypothetical protein [Nonomuraea sp. NPDC049129]
MLNVESLTAKQVLSRILVAIRPEESSLMAWELMRRGDSRPASSRARCG